jgi:hypothetical protein
MFTCAKILTLNIQGEPTHVWKIFITFCAFGLLIALFIDTVNRSI